MFDQPLEKHMHAALWSTTQARGMGPMYHHLHGLSRPNLLNCTEDEARKLASANAMLGALEAAEVLLSRMGMQSTDEYQEVVTAIKAALP